MAGKLPTVVRLNHVKDTDLAWAAGIIDGEGCISIVKARAGKERKTGGCEYALRIDVTATDPRMLAQLQAIFGCVVYIQKRWDKARENHSQAYAWRIAGKSAGPFLEQIYPYLVCKKDQADLALQFFKTMGTQGRHLPLEVVEFRGELHKELKSLHGRK